MAKFEFPRNPGTRGRPRLVDEDGKNPFAESPDEPAGIDAGPYSAPAGGDAARPYQPGDYQPQLPHRGRLILTLGAVGVIAALLGLMVAAVSVALSGDWTEGLFYCVPVQCLCLAVSLPAWILGQSDLRALRAGAMDPRGRTTTVIGLQLGRLATLLSLLPAVTLLAGLAVQA